MVVQAAIGDEEHLRRATPCGRRRGPRRCLPRRPGSGRARSRAAPPAARAARASRSRADWRRSAPGRELLAGEVGNAEAAAEVERPAPAPARARPGAAPARTTLAAPRRSTRHAGSASRRKGESPRTPGRRRRSRASSSGTCSTSTPNCFGPPPIFMPEPLSSKSGLTRTATRAGTPSSARSAAESRHLAHRLDVDQHAGGDRLAQLDVALAGAGEADLGRVGAGVQRDLQLAGRSHVDAVDQSRP